jgi:alkaline phosphatase
MNEKSHRWARIHLIVAVFTLFFAFNVQASNLSAKYIIFMVPDGMGQSNVTAARIYKNGLDGAPLHFQTLLTIGIQSTYSKNATVTDSAPAASAWACGEKFNNGEICKHTEGMPNNQTILELIKARKKATGLVATSQITHATPAAFAAHVTNRNCQNEIARQYILETKPDVILGGGRQKWDTDPATDPDASGCPQYATDLVTVAQMPANGYTFVSTKVEMKEKVAAGKKKLLGLFSDQGMTPTYQRPGGTTEPTLAEMTNAALTILDKNTKGFFLMVEGSQIDWANHARDLEYQVKDVLAFDDAVKAVLDWINDKKYPSRKVNTMLIIAPDHETGGFAINGPMPGLSQKGNLSTITAGWTFDAREFPKEANHSGSDVVVYSQGPGTERVNANWPGLGRFFDNTELYSLMKKVSGIK